MGTRSTSSTTVKLDIASTVRNTFTDGQVASASVGQTYLAESLANGVGASQCNRVWESRARSLADDAHEDIDLYDLGAIDIGAGAGKDILGQAMALEEIVLLVIKHVSGAGSLEVNPVDPTNKAAWTPTLTVANGGALKAGGCLLMYQPATNAFDIADGRSHKLRLHAEGGAVSDYDILLIGRHDDEESSSESTSTSTSTSQSVSSSTSQSVSSHTNTSSTQSATTSSQSSASTLTSASTSSSLSTLSSASSSTQSATTSSLSPG